MTAYWVSSVIGAAVFCATIGLVTVLFCRALSDISRYQDRLISRHHRELQSLLDRLTAVKWEDYAALRSISEPEQEGGFFEPGESTPENEDERETAVQVISPGLWGRLHRNESELLDEDFDEVGNPR